jgi:hypothetical protein
MVISDIDSHFQALWHRALNASSLGALTPELIHSWASERGLDVTHAEQLDVGIFEKTQAIVLTVGNVKACFPKISATGDPNWELRRQAAEANAALWEKMEWFSPLWIPMGEVQKILNDAKNRPRERAIELFNYHTSTLYTVPFQAVCIAQILPQANSLKEFCPLAREAFLAFYSGYRASSISALIPAIEGSLTRIVSGSSNDLQIFTKIDRVINRAIESAARLHYEQMWAPQDYLSKDYLFGQDERVFTFETFRCWLQNSFFQKTGEYDGVTWLNRHMFAHGTHSSWQQSANFSRLVVALATLALIESWHDETHRVSLFFPEMNEDSKLLWQQALFQGQAQMNLKLIEQQRYQKHGRLVPEMPTDDGVLLRKAILSDDCIKDLVRPLRDAGWSVEVGEPDKEALYMTVAATAEHERFEAALLFSCATDNKIYRKLAETSGAILFRGAPYHQEQFTYGINVHVGPVTGWQPPQASHRKRVWRSHPLWKRLVRLRARAAVAVKFVKYAWVVWRNRSPFASH